MSQPYIGRFAPSPSGPLHFGSLVTALGSFMEARLHDGQWLLRMEDHDPPREMPGAADEILRTLDAFGFEWDGKVVYQSQRGELYEAALAKLADDGLTFHCRCTRSQLKAAGQMGPMGLIYPGSCRELGHGSHDAALRLRVPDREFGFEDAVLGGTAQNLARELGDFVLRRRDGLYAYQLVVVVDDADQGITDVVRGSDLYDNTPRQLYLQTMLDLPRPDYIHLPIATNAAGEKLSKQTYATALDASKPLPALIRAWKFLGQTEFAETPVSTEEFWHEAIAHWSVDMVPKQAAIIAVEA